MNELTHLDLFSGIGGFSIAAKWAGFRTVGFSEVEPYACKILAEKFPGVPNLGDVRKLDASRIGPVTVLTGGYPCQPFSLAGKRGGASDDRHLWPAMRDVIESVRPSWVIGENVFGHVSMGLDVVLTDLEALGYAVQPFVIPACGVDARHKRERLWIVANACSGRLHRENIGESELAGRTEAICRGEDVADATRLQQGREEQRAIGQRAGASSESVDGANAHGERKLQPQGTEREVGRRLGDLRAHVANARSPGRQERNTPSLAAREGHNPGRDAAGWSAWLPEPAVGRVAYGIPDRAHRLKGLGNAIVPQVVEPFLHWIAQIEKGEIA